ncbi:cell division protein FtsK [Variovorax paradoxus]|jgi:S-DNA-T family DNA segregation ATPase FtsK/SpoIIIE|uniref:DNA translocase FtsK n=1 Tax=Variovorax paradoxus TaxID=34073 RepID=UPI0006E702D3|nr:cell division protein FtsK [Variovorax paradoxus]KPV01267.1 cell division protein FtsK [Variovorax paradoxus]KPV01991.1 cell division protein FtsK [Variovorax paradoxus]KPV17485.1 cell division protein FtsK [Variovorax paradoxus]KPV24775.1 cell division protein FtsK [Variovorax paradoxus]
MTYSLNTLHSSTAGEGAPVRVRAMRFAHEITLIAGFAALLFWLLAMLSFTPSDAAWSTSGTGGEIKNWGGRIGAWVADGSYFLAGYSVWWCLAAGLRAWLSSLASWMRGGEEGPQGDPAPRGRFNRSRLAFWFGLVLLLCASTMLEWSRLYRLESHLPGSGGGAIGLLVGPASVRWMGFTGSALVAIAGGVIGWALVFRFSWSQIAERIGARVYSLFESRREKREVAADIALGKKAVRERRAEVDDEPAYVPRGAVEPSIDGEHQSAAVPDMDDLRIEPRAKRRPASPPVQIEPAMTEVPKSDRVAKERQKPLFKELPDNKLPQVDLLDAAQARQETVSSDTLEMTSRMIEKKLKDFGVEVRVVLASPGPVITRYEIEPATGVKGSQIVNLAKDLARSLSLVSIRVVETIPGKNYMALELPNAKRQSIKLSEILGSQVYNEGKSMLTMGLGKDIIGNPVVADLAKMPHVLVAGTTGSGKSVGINAMILSLLYKAEARDVRLLMIDPKMLEMSVYEGIPHLLAPVVTDMRQAAHGLNWCVAEMERRYKLMSKLGVRNLAGYNTKIDEAKAREEFINNPFSLTPDDPEPLRREPHIVVVIDELADLMMVVGKKIEELIARLAQKARAAGIHLILATQRPSVDVITGLIKANIPTRIAFQVSSKIDSRTILDQMGAEALLGMGDMLYMPSGTGLPVRVHGAFVSDEEVHRVVAYLKSQGEPDYIEGVLEGGTVDGDGDGDLLGGGGDSEKDPMYDQAVEVVLKNRKASISLVQRHLKIGYNRAARLVEDMEKAGLVSAMSGSGQREILVPARAE